MVDPVVDPAAEKTIRDAPVRIANFLDIESDGNTVDDTPISVEVVSTAYVSHECKFKYSSRSSHDLRASRCRPANVSSIARLAADTRSAERNASMSMSSLWKV